MDAKKRREEERKEKRPTSYIFIQRTGPGTFDAFLSLLKVCVLRVNW